MQVANLPLEDVAELQGPSRLHGTPVLQQLLNHTKDRDFRWVSDVQQMVSFLLKQKWKVCFL